MNSIFFKHHWKFDIFCAWKMNINSENSDPVYQLLITWSLLKYYTITEIHKNLIQKIVVKLTKCSTTFYWTVRFIFLRYARNNSQICHQIWMDPLMLSFLSNSALSPHPWAHSFKSVYTRKARRNPLISKWSIIRINSVSCVLIRWWDEQGMLNIIFKAGKQVFSR